MDLVTATLLGEKQNLSLTRKEWMINEKIHFTIHPKKSGSVGTLISSHNSSSERTVGKLWHPSYEDIVANDWELVTISVLSSDNPNPSEQQIELKLVEKLERFETSSI